MERQPCYALYAKITKSVIIPWT